MTDHEVTVIETINFRPDGSSYYVWTMENGRVLYTLEGAFATIVDEGLFGTGWERKEPQDVLNLGIYGLRLQSGFGLVPEKAEGQRLPYDPYDDGVALYSISHPDGRRLRDRLRDAWNAFWGRDTGC